MTFVFVIKMKTIIYYFAILAVTVSSIGIIRLYYSSNTSPTAAPINTSDVKQEELTENDVALPSAAKKDSVKVPILMYHSILRSTNTHGDYIITESAFESDLKYLKDNGYTTIVMQDLIDFVCNGKKLPEKPVVLTFDDGYSNNYLSWFLLLYSDSGKNPWSFGKSRYQADILILL